jgi:hypothetical protein
VFEKEITGGMSFLDAYFEGKSWVFGIDLGELDLKSGCNCVLGQLNGDYDTMMDILDLDDEDSHKLGFSVDSYGPEFAGRPTDFVWDQLTEEWRVALKDRVDLGVEL